MPCILVLLRFKKKLTVTGNIAYRQGCKTEMLPHRKPSRKVDNKDFSVAGPCATCAKTKRLVKQKAAVNMIFNFFNTAS